MKRSPAPAGELPALTVREVEVLEMLGLGLTNEQIARRVGLSTHTVKFHLATLYNKLGVANRTEAAVAYTRHTGLAGGAAGPAA
jgi:DNA-binding NarL/FixJ family response regulator